MNDSTSPNVGSATRSGSLPEEGPGPVGNEDLSDSQQDEARFTYLHSTNFPDLLETIGATLMVTTYQAGKLVVFRSREGKISMLLRTFDKAMGLAVNPHRMAIATTYQIWTLLNSPLVAGKLEPRGQHDGCFLPRTSHVTANIDSHEIAWAGDELWVVNTLFSCLCTLEADYSFVPRWKPPFVTRLARHDACHLNGLAIENGCPKYVTAFGETNEREGWRGNKVDGGCVIDVESGAVVARGLSMPHSPRLHEGRLWLLDSGRGRLCHVDPSDGRIETVCELPGYTRGLAFAGRLAFVGLSKIRETSVFGGVPVADRLKDEERKCGVAVVDLQSGRVVAFLEFQGSVEELFDVQLLTGLRYPAVVGFNKDTIQRACVIAPERPI